MYDYIIVGAGSAGCVLANRLTADPNCTVLLLEAGGSDQRPEVQTPAAFPNLLRTPLDWAYSTEEQPHLHNRKLYWPRGKMLGGSSSLNAMVYIRGDHLDYDEWRNLGNEGWGDKDVLPYFKKAQHQERGASKYHGSDGPLNVADPRSPNALAYAFIAAGQQLAIARNDDFNGTKQEGVGLVQLTQKRGQRHSSATAYLKPILGRPNLSVLTHAHATRILVEEKRAIGVTYQQNGQLHEARAGREIILCGGAINSPQLLLLSGIGPADQLKALELPVIVDLPGVGQNLQDHLGMAVAYHCSKPITLLQIDTFWNKLQYMFWKKGPLASNLAEAAAFVRTRPELQLPDVEILLVPLYLSNQPISPAPEHSFTFVCALLRPQSSGEITLCSNNPLDPPRIQPNYLACDADLQVMIDGVKLCRRWAQTRALAPFRGEEITPGEDVQSDEQIAEAIRARADTIFHPVGTCKMGNDAMAVVDHELRVHGITGLRVADASIMPTLIRGHTNAPAIMIGEKAADLVKKSVIH
ncbi:MAG: choline dehydrogenase [Chloroflexi bacterium]|nr:MAG: choline dehydrogenase [Chloroflexota bacterium]